MRPLSAVAAVLGLTVACSSPTRVVTNGAFDLSQ